MREHIKKMKDLIVVGGGASGIAAAIEASHQGISNIAILESQSSLGCKLLTTGAGKCNFTNMVLSSEDYPVAQDSELIKNLTRNLSGQYIVDWFRKIGLNSVVKENNKVYPRPEKARSLLKILEMELRDLNVDVILSAKVTGFIRDTGKKWFSINVLNDSGEEKLYEAKNLLIATGGMTYPSTGSDGNGYSLLTSSGHTLITPVPVMVPFNCKFKGQKILHGQKISANVKLLSKGVVLHSAFGDIMFTRKGVSGLAIFELTAASPPDSYRGLELQISLFHNEFKKVDCQKKLQILAKKYPNRTLDELLTGFFPHKIIKVFVKETDRVISLSTGVDKFNGALENCVDTLSSIVLIIESHGGWAHGQVTSGGISLDDITSGFQSKIIPGLWITGEMLNVHGLCGGYNLHFAWSSGIIAARQVANNLSK